MPCPFQLKSLAYAYFFLNYVATHGSCVPTDCGAKVQHFEMEIYWMLTSVRYKNPHGVCVICRAIFAEQKSEFCYKREQKPNLFGLCRVKTKS